MSSTVSGSTVANRERKRVEKRLQGDLAYLDWLRKGGRTRQPLPYQSALNSSEDRRYRQVVDRVELLGARALAADERRAWLRWSATTAW
jgi:hypothetical protein